MERHRADGLCLAPRPARHGRETIAARSRQSRDGVARVLALNVPLAVGSLALAAVLSAELSSADAVLFMLATSGARDFYRGILHPEASDAEVLRVARGLAVVSGFVGFILTFYLDSVVSAITLFYQVMIVTLFAPILGGLLLPRAGRWSALAAMIVGVGTMITNLDRHGRRRVGLGPASLPGIGREQPDIFVLAAF